MLTLWREGALKVQSRPHGGLEVFVEREVAGERQWCKIFDIHGANVSLIVEPVALDCRLREAEPTAAARCLD